MFIDKVRTEGLAHFSYVVGDGTQAAVIDPRRDFDIYVDMARQRGARITHILETHRNEDFVSGAVNLAEATGAHIFHGLDFGAEVHYANVVKEGDRFRLGKMILSVLETPGHTDDSLSFVVHDADFGEEPVAVFTGDTLFVGDVGRTDFDPERSAEAAGSLYDSLQKLLKLGDQVIVFPAHGAGSVCADKTADRDFSTIGYERQNNPMLKIGERQAFVDRKRSEHHYQPPYFRLMDRINRTGMEEAPVLRPPPLGIEDFCRLRDDATVVDVRSSTAFMGAHIPGSLSIPVAMTTAFAGWLLEANQSVLLVAEDERQTRETAAQLARIGYDNVVGYLALSLPHWVAADQAIRSVQTVDLDPAEQAGNERILLDVRSENELSGGNVPGAEHIYAGELPEYLPTLDPRKSYLVLGASGAASTAASVLLKAGFQDVAVFLGPITCWQSPDLTLGQRRPMEQDRERPLSRYY